MIKIALLGAESTGKTQLAESLTATLCSRGHSVSHIPEYLRLWCDTAGRTPRAEEQWAIANAQTARISQAPVATYLIADTTALMTAVYSELLFGDDSLYAIALEQQRSFDLTLVMGLDLPWAADPLRDGPHSQAPVDVRLRAALARGNLPYQVVYGKNLARIQNALLAIESITAGAGEISARGRFSSKNSVPWIWNCEKCSDPECEHRLFSSLLNR
ncbi:Nicotinamide riboside kinase [Rhodoferax sp. OV413]|uniref:AAA family ATPase n=1 Tax=Rhodoferax sp. OV413 TaxID=1855285 RepID=UPI00088C1561|nr:Nicotinamide riboside kinase [Rhodoferax sp. OV413]